MVIDKISFSLTSIFSYPFPNIGRCSQIQNLRLLCCTPLFAPKCDACTLTVGLEEVAFVLAVVECQNVDDKLIIVGKNTEGEENKVIKVQMN